MWFGGEFVMTDTNGSRGVLHGLLYVVFWRVFND